MYSGGIHPSEKGKTMKRTIGMLCLTLALLLALAACRPANSIFNELILDGIHTHYKNLKSGMTLDEVLAAEKLTQDDVEIQENESSVDGHIYTLATTKAEYFYAESGELGLSKLYYFRDNGLLQMSYQKHIPSAEFDEGIAKAREFMVKFVENSGAKVVMTARGEEKLSEAVSVIRAQGFDVTGVVADNKNLDDVKRVIQTALDVYGDLDIVINNAAIGEQKMIDETDDEWLEHVYQTNVFGPFRFIREALKIFLPKNEGCIINISSVNGDRPFCGASYTSSKGAINTLTKNVAMRLIDTNIRINAVAPGATVTPAHLANKAGEQPGGAKMLEYSKHFVYFPGPECDPIDQANACLFLASDMGRHVKGQVIQVCNGAFL